MKDAQFHGPATLPMHEHPQLITERNAVCSAAGLTWTQRLKSLPTNQTLIFLSPCI